MYQFKYTRLESVTAAEELLSGEEDSVLLAGGMTLLPTMKQRLAQPAQLLDLAGISNLRGITKADSVLTIKAMMTHAEVAGSDDVKASIPSLASLADGIGDPQVRNRGTIGGSVANADPAADYPAAVVALDGTIVTNHRAIKADEFFIDIFETALEGNEIITGVTFKVPDRAAYAKFPNPASRYAIVGVFIAEFGGSYRVAVTGAGGSVFRLAAVEEALGSDASSASIANALQDNPVDADELNDDIHASNEYRAHLTGIMTTRAFEAL